MAQPKEEQLWVTNVKDDAQGERDGEENRKWRRSKAFRDITKAFALQKSKKILQ